MNMSTWFTVKLNLDAKTMRKGKEATEKYLNSVLKDTDEIKVTNIEFEGSDEELAAEEEK